MFFWRKISFYTDLIVSSIGHLTFKGKSDNIIDFDSGQQRVVLSQAKGEGWPHA
jgi:hypothetical protein